jgi:DNA-binding GntR family transcriptional regulator
LVCLPEQRFPNLGSATTIPDDLEELAQNSGVLVARAEGKVRAIPAPHAAARALSLSEGAFVLCLERLCFDTDDLPIETMTAYYDLKDEYCKFEMR